MIFDQARNAAREYHAAWRKKNRLSIRKRAKLWRDSHKEQRRKERREHYLANREATIAKSAKWCRENIVHRTAYLKEYHKQYSRRKKEAIQARLIKNMVADTPLYKAFVELDNAPWLESHVTTDQMDPSEILMAKEEGRL